MCGIAIDAAFQHDCVVHGVGVGIEHIHGDGVAFGGGERAGFFEACSVERGFCGGLEISRLNMLEPKLGARKGGIVRRPAIAHGGRGDFRARPAYQRAVAHIVFHRIGDLVGQLGRGGLRAGGEGEAGRQNEDGRDTFHLNYPLLIEEM